MAGLLEDGPSRPVLELAELGIQHEQQHQELLLMDIKHVLSRNPMQPAFDAIRAPEPSVSRTRTWTTHAGGNFDMGYGGEHFCFDNELPRHRVYLAPFALADQLVTCGDWLDFMLDDGYQRPELWLSDGWATVQSEGWRAPLLGRVGEWLERVHSRGPDARQSCAAGMPPQLLRGRRLRSLGRIPLAHGKRMGGRDHRRPVEGYFLDQTRLHPSPPTRLPADSSHFGNVWQWTSSAYCPYPGFEPAKGAVGEYNGKFMVNQYVLRGGSCVTPAGHLRSSYRNFLPGLGPLGVFRAPLGTRSLIAARG